MDGRLIARIAEAGREEVDAAVRAAHAAQQGVWGGLTTEQRIDLLYGVADEITRRFEDFVAAEMADTGQAFPLIQGDGVMRGSFVIEGISTTRSEFFADGTARKIEFTIKLKRVDDNDSSLGNTLLGRTAGNLFGRLGVGKLVGSIGSKLGGIL